LPPATKKIERDYTVEHDRAAELRSAHPRDLITLDGQ
jgi:hypothetical protein